MKKFIYNDDTPLYVSLNTKDDAGKNKVIDVVAVKGDTIEVPENNQWVIVQVKLGKLTAAEGQQSTVNSQPKKDNTI